jgi:cellulose biosynthesis protein BcsQ
VVVHDAKLPIADVRTLASGASAIRAALHRKVVIVVNGKGGVGKSSVTSNFAVNSAALGKRTLLVEMDPQGNTAEDLGFVRDTAIYDGGKSQADAILNGAAIQPTGEVRTRLYVAPGGEHLERVHQELYVQQRAAELTGDPAWVYMYASALAQAARYYDMILLDVAPGSSVLQLQALIAGDMVVIPSRSDPSSRKGLRAVARRVGEARQFNNQLVLLGVVLFATGRTGGSSPRGVQAAIRRGLENDLGNSTTVFSATIRHAEAAAVACRTAGRVAQELAFELGHEDPLWRAVNSLGHDYRMVTTEIFQKIAVLNHQEQQS